MRILLIEDESLAARRLQKMLERILADLGPWGRIDASIDWAEGPDAALERAAAQPDLIFLDLNLDGFNTLEWLRARKLPPGQVIIVSADTRYCDEAFALGVFAYLFKPLDESQLRAQVERYIRARNLIA